MNNCFHFRKHQRNNPPDVTRTGSSRNSFFSVTTFCRMKPNTSANGDRRRPCTDTRPARDRQAAARRSQDATRVGNAVASLHLRDRASATRRWWRRSGSNRRPPACKAGALPAELRPNFRDFSSPNRLVGQGGFEPPTPRLSSVCSNQLSY